MLLLVGYASSSVVDTMGTLSFSNASICGVTLRSDELVHNTATSGRPAFTTFFTSSVTLTRSGRPRPATSPRSRPTFAGSMSTAPTILKPFRSATCLTTPTPIGPSPTCITLIGPDPAAINAPERMRTIRDYTRPGNGRWGIGDGPWKEPAQVPSPIAHCPLPMV